MSVGPWKPAIQKYARWISAQDARSAKHWQQAVDSTDESKSEGAIAEAVTWEFLRCQGVEVELNDCLGSGGPDFLCATKGDRFYVEVTNLSKTAVTASTGLSDEPCRVGSHGTVTRLVKREVMAKAGRIGRVEWPVLVWVTTFHFAGSALLIQRHHVKSLLMSDPVIVVDIDRSTGGAVTSPYQGATFDSSIATRSGSLDEARKNISGVVLAGFGLVPPARAVLGAILPGAVRPFDSQLLPNIPFVQFAHWPPSKDDVDFEWSDDRARSDDRHTSLAE